MLRLKQQVWLFCTKCPTATICQHHQCSVLIQWCAALQAVKRESSAVLNTESKLTVSKVPAEAGRHHTSRRALPAQELWLDKEARKAAHSRLTRLANVLISTRRDSWVTEGHLTDAQKRVSTLEAWVSAAKKDHEAVIASHETQSGASSAQLAEALSAKAAAQNQQQLLQETVTGLSAQLAQAAADQRAADVQSNTEKADLSRQLAKALAGNALLDTHSHELQADNADLSAQLASMQSGKTATEKQLHQLQESNNQMSAELTAVSSGKLAAEEKLQQLQGDNVQVSNELVSMVSSRRATEEQLERSTACNQQLSVQLADAARQLVQLKTDNQTNTVELGVAEAAWHGAEERLGVHQGQLLKLQAQVTSASKLAALHAGHITASAVCSAANFRVTADKHVNWHLMLVISRHGARM